MHIRIPFKTVLTALFLAADGLVSYSMAQGQDRGMEVDLLDLSYDGTTTEGLLYGGLGQLHDGMTGNRNFRADIGHGKGKAGEEGREGGDGVGGEGYQDWKGGKGMERRGRGWRKRVRRRRGEGGKR